MTDPIEVRVAETAEEVQRIRAASADLVTYGHILVVVAVDPDDPGAVVASTNVTVGAPCSRRAAKLLREIAAQLEQAHPPGECGVSAWP